MPPYKRIKITDEEDILEISEKPNSKEKNDDWREKANSFKERHQYAMKQGILTDVTFSVGPLGIPLSAHKMILALASPVFEAMFYGTLKETSDTIGIPDLMPNGFQLLLDYIYTDNMEFKNETDALYAWFAADKYCLSHMRDICLNYLSSCELTNENVWIILENSVFLNSPSLTERCLLYLKKNIDHAIRTYGFLDISSETLKKILLMESLYIKEVDLLRGVVRWSEEKIKNGTDNLPLQEFLVPYLRHIRFGCMSQMDFVEFIDEHKNIISDSDSLAIVKYMTDHRNYSLPVWCSLNVYPRKACEKRQESAKKMTLSIRSYAIKPQLTTRLVDAIPYDQSGDQPFHSSRNERRPTVPQNASGPSRRRAFVLSDSSSFSDDDDVVAYSDSDDVSRRAVAASHDSDDSTSSYSSSSSSSQLSFSH